MTVAEYYLNKVKNVLDGREDCRELVDLQKRAFTQACNSIKINDSTFQFVPNNKSIKADKIATDQLYYGMVAKRLFCGTIDATLFFDQYGKATCAYAGILNGSDSMAKVSNLLETAERLRAAMNEAMEQLVEEVANNETNNTSCFIMKQSDTCFTFGGIRSDFYNYVACVKTIDLAKYSDQSINKMLSHYFNGNDILNSLDKLHGIFEEKINQFVAYILFKQTFLSDMDFKSEPFVFEACAKRALVHLMKKATDGTLPKDSSKEPEWTDDNKRCMIHKISDTSFYYGEVRIKTRYNELCYVICAKRINLDDYSKEGIEDNVRSFYQNGIAEVKETCKDQANKTLAECIFEMTPTSEMDYVSCAYRNEDDAVKGLAEFAKIEAECFKVPSKQ